MDLLKSKKFQATIAALVVQLLGQVGFDIDADTMLKFISPIFVYIIGQGWADMGKEKAKVEAARN